MENSVDWDRAFTKETMSLCPVCYAVIPAKIQLLKSVWMKKQCPAHGVFVAIVERDPWWYTFCLRRASSSLYDGYFMDITNRCNISCKYCYRRCGERDDVIIDRAIEDIFTEAKMYNRYAPFILTGGEPTAHPDFLEIIRRISEIGETYFITNGIKLCDEGFLKSVIDQGILGADNELKIGLSIHRESNGKDIEFLNICKQKGYKIQTVLYTIDKIDQINDAISLFREYRETITRGRIRAASAIWSDKNLIVDKIFVSDMINHLQAMGPTEIMNYNNFVSYGCIKHDGLDLRLISWYNINNIDLNDANCSPFGRAKDGNVYPLITAWILNESPTSEIRDSKLSLFDFTGGDR